MTFLYISLSFFLLISIFFRYHRCFLDFSPIFFVLFLLVNFIPSQVRNNGNRTKFFMILMQNVFDLCADSSVLEWATKALVAKHNDKNWQRLSLLLFLFLLCDFLHTVTFRLHFINNRKKIQFNLHTVNSFIDTFVNRCYFFFVAKMENAYTQKAHIWIKYITELAGVTENKQYGVDLFFPNV